MNEEEQMLVMAVAAVVHLLEYIATGEDFDFAAARSNLLWPKLVEWYEENGVLLPARRDGKTMAEALGEGT